MYVINSHICKKMTHKNVSIYDRIKEIRLNAGLTQEEFAASIGLKRGNLANIEIGRQLPTIETITDIVRIYDTTFDWIIAGQGAKGVHKKSSINVHPSVHPSVLDPAESYTKRVYTATELLPHVVDTSGLRLVPVVDISAAAGTGYINHEAIDDTQVLRLPVTMVKSGYHLCIRVKGPSMAPTFQDGGFLVIRLLDRSEWLNLRNEYCYVVVDNEGKTFIKRVKNRFSGEIGGFIVCTSDNPDKTSHPNFNLHPNEIQHIWFVEWYFTAKMPNIHDQYYTRVSNLEDKFDLLTEEFRNFKRQLK